MVRAAPSANANMTGKAATFATLFLRVFLPFAFAYFLSYIFRGVNAVIFPYLERDIGITAGDLGLLTSAFFLFFAGCQPVLGVMLDRYGPRRVQAVLLAMAAAGSTLFGLSLSLGELIVARALIGLGFAGGLMAAIKAITIWYPSERWGLITGFHMMAGGLGSMAATLPIEWSLSVVSWQGLFFWLAGLCLATAAILFVVVPERPVAAAKGTLGEQFRITGAVLTDGFYWRIQPLVSVQQLAFIGCITLWIGPWLRDVGGIADKEARADIQLYTTAVMTLGFAMSGVIAGGFRRIGVSNFASVGIASLLFALVCGWLAFLPSFHPCRTRHDQQQPGRLHRDLRRPVGDRKDRRPVAQDRHRLRARRLHLGVRRALHPAACGSVMADAVAGAADGASAPGRGRLSAATRSRTS